MKQLLCRRFVYVPAVPVKVVNVTETFLSNIPVTFSRTIHISPLVPSGIVISVSWIETVAPMTRKLVDGSNQRVYSYQDKIIAKEKNPT